MGWSGSGWQCEEAEDVRSGVGQVWWAASNPRAQKAGRDEFLRAGRRAESVDFGLVGRNVIPK